MNQFLQRILTELNTNPSINSEPLVKMLVGSANKSIALGESTEAIYTDLKNSLTSINENLNNPTIKVILKQFSKNEDTVDSRLLKIAKESNLLDKINLLKESQLYSEPVAKAAIDLFESELNSGIIAAALCGKFVDVFEQYSYDVTAKTAVDNVKKYITENWDKLLMLRTIYQIDNMRVPSYAGVVSDLKNMLVKETYTADILKIKYNNTVAPITHLINDLRIFESQKNGSFTVGEGNSDTVINNLIAPSTRTADGMIIYTDNRFLSIREAKGLIGTEVKVHYDGNFKISDLSPEYVSENHSDFYNLCEAYHSLGFSKTQDGLGVETHNIKNLRVGLRMNENKSLDVFINGEKIGEPKSINVSEALALDSNLNKTRLTTILENIETIYNFEFIKEVSNDRRIAEASILNLNKDFYICEKVNSADRVWTKVDEFELYEFFKSKFDYDISPIFKTKIEESVDALNKAEAAKAKINSDIQKLEESIQKLDTAIENPNLTDAESGRLSSIKESIESTIKELKETYIRIDLLKKKELA